METIKLSPLRKGIVGVQFLFVAFGATVLVPLLVGLDPATALFSAGIGTFIFHFVTKGKVPIFLGSSFAFIAPIIEASKLWGMPGTLAGIAGVALVYFIMSVLIKWQGQKLLNRLFPPVVIGPVIILIGLTLSGSAVNMAKTNWPLAGISLLTAILVLILGRGLIRLVPVVCGIVTGYIAALKLRMMEDLQNPTVVIIDDRLDLETQITATFQTTDIPNLASLSTKEDVERFFEQDTRKIAITTIFRFGDVDHVLNERSNIIVLVDEAHRTQEGDLGARMRLALPNAFFFGLTGTPINKLDHNTFKTFGSTEDPSGYMSKYSFADSIRDHATLPLRFEPVPVELHIDKEKLETEFDALTEGLTDDQRAELSRRVNMKAIMYNRERIRKVCEHIVRHFQTKVAPNGYKGQIVVYDRECCLMYKEELDRLLPPEASTIVMDTNNDKAGRYKKYARSRADEEKLLDTFREKTSPLKLVIVTSKLLTGFDAPILQCMYLDKPMKDHTLLQAICRVNRVYDEGKALGLVVDYIGIFDDAAKALSFDDASMKKVIENIEGIKEQLPILLAKCLSYFNGVDRTKEGWEGLIEAQEKLPDNETKDKFAADYGVLNKVWNILSPDKPMDQSGALIWASLGPKTMQLIDENIEVGDADETIEAITMDPDMIERFIAQPNPEKAAKKIEIQLIAILRKKHSKKYQEIGEKLERLREQHEQRLINSVEFLRQLLELAREAARAEQEVVPKEEQDKGKAALTELFNGIKTEHTPVMVERIVGDIDNIVRLVRFDGWQNTATGQKEVQRALRKIVWQKYSIKDPDIFEKAYKYIEEYC